MELTYKVRGADGKEYGPVLLEQLTGWIAQGRLPAQQPVKRSDMDYWASAGDFAELQPAYGAGSSDPTDEAAVMAGVSQRASGPSRARMRWLYWAAGAGLIVLVGYFLWHSLAGAGR